MTIEHFEPDRGGPARAGPDPCSGEKRFCPRPPDSAKFFACPRFAPRGWNSENSASSHLRSAAEENVPEASVLVSASAASGATR